MSENKKIVGEILGYVIRHPSESGVMRYCYGDDPEQLKAKYYEGFNPVMAIVRLDTGRIIEPGKEVIL